MQGSSIAPGIVQEMLESASNAASKGMSQFFTPVAFGAALAQALPTIRPVIVDLTCGNGQLLNAASNDSTHDILGSDIDPCRWAPMVPTQSADPKSSEVRHIKIAGDITRLYPMLVDVDWFADCFALNPPWDVHWYRERLAPLAKSEVRAVREAFAAHDGRTGRDTIDSTVATLCIALDRCTVYGEGFLIANEATLQRLIFEPEAPHAALAQHIWAHIIISGNPMTGIKDCSFQKGEDFKTGVIYFSRDHARGCQFTEGVAIERLKLSRPNFYQITYPYQVCDSTISKWQAVAGEWKALQSERRTDWNLWLDGSGEIGVQLSLFDENSVKVDKYKARDLFKLKGRRPMQLVLQRAQRKELEAVVFDSPWRVQPALQDAVKQAVKDYHAQRAPLYPLPEIQRLAYLDEEDNIECKKAFRDFIPGKSYPLETSTVTVIRDATRMNLAGEPEQIEYTGSELAIVINGVCFMDTRLREDNVRIDSWKGIKVDATLQELVEHFTIPEVPDVAIVNPDQYKRNMETLNRIFSAINS